MRANIANIAPHAVPQPLRMICHASLVQDHYMQADMQPQLWKAHWVCGRVTCFGRFGTSAAAAAETCILQSLFRVVLWRRSTRADPWPTDAQPVWPRVLCRNGLPCPRSSALMAL